MQGEGRPASHKQWALCVFDDLLEFASSSAIKYRDYFLSPMLKCICAKSPSVRQVGWGVGVAGGPGCGCGRWAGVCVLLVAMLRELPFSSTNIQRSCNVFQC